VNGALVFDCDGVLADTERDGHLVAFNQAFEELGLAVRWSEERYAELLSVGGGKERLRSLFGPGAPADPALPTDPAEQDALVRRLHARKTEIFVELVDAGRLPARPGVRRLVEEALDAGWVLAVASTSAPASVHAVLERAVGAENAQRFGGVFAGDLVAAKKPAPDIYLRACSELGLDTDRTVVVEDSAVGAAAAAAAGLAHLVTVSTFTRDEEFPEAAAVVSSLGDAAEPAVVLAARTDVTVDGVVTLDTLRQCMGFRPALR